MQSTPCAQHEHNSLFSAQTKYFEHKLNAQWRFVNANLFGYDASILKSSMLVIDL